MAEQECNHREGTTPTNMLSRLLTLTDGVFAIIMTILVLELKAPNSDTAVFGTAYQLLIYAISFLLAGVNWVGHNMIFGIVKKVDPSFVWLNIIFLMFASLIPFSANILMNSQISVSLTGYGILATLLTGTRLAMYGYATSHDELVHATIPPQRRRKVLRIMIFAPVMFLLSLCIVPFFPVAVLVLYAITPLVFAAAISRVNHAEVKEG